MLTRRQRQVLDFIQGYIGRNGFPPAVREIGSRFGICPATVQDHLRALERKGRLTKKPFRSRSIRITGHEPAGARRVRVPIVGSVAAGVPIMAAEDIENSVELPAGWAPPGGFLLKVRGDSMEGAHIVDGDYVLVKPQPAARNGDVVVALIGDDATVKRFHRIGQTIRLVAENPTFDPIEIREKEGTPVRLVGRVVGVVRMEEA